MPASICRSCRLLLRKNNISSNTLRRRNHTLTGELGRRPPLLPKAIIDIKHIRNNPGLYEKDCIDRNYASLAKHPWTILELYNEHHAVNQRIQKPRAHLKTLNEAIKKLAAEYDAAATAQKNQHDDDNGRGKSLEDMEADKTVLLAESKELRQSINSDVQRAAHLLSQAQQLALELPNLASTQTPIGNDPEVLQTIGEVQAEATSHQTSHEVIGAELDIIDIPAAAAFSGWGFYYLKGAGAMLEQALIQHALSIARKAGFIPVIPPSLVYSHAAWACGFRPRDEGGNKQVYAIEADNGDGDGDSTPRLSLAGTAEIPLAGLYMNQTLTEAQLPLNHVGISRCYRAEAGSRGRDTKGLYRVHEFTKVELFAWTLPDSTDTSDHFSALPPTSPSSDTLQAMLDLQIAILSPLNIPLRILNQPTGDLGASASIKYDIEGHFPSRSPSWGELSSLSNCTDYQSRRLGTRLMSKGSGKLEWPYTLNGTAMAVPRVLAAILENNYNVMTKEVAIPDCLRKWMDDATVIRK